MKNIFDLLQRLWNSPAFMTWVSMLTRSLTLILTLPLILTRLDTSDIALWYLFSSVIGLQMLVDVGFSPTFSRVIAFAMGGLDAKELRDLREFKGIRQKNEPNWQTVEQICSAMRIVYGRLTLLSLIGLCIFGTWALAKPISLSSHPRLSWAAWVVIVGTSVFTLLGNMYTSYLQGINQIALLRRWETITSLGSIITSFLILVLNGNLFGLVLVNQSWLIVNVLRNRWLSRFIENSRFKKFTHTNTSEVVFDAVWPSAWRSGVGIFMTYGLVQLSGIFYAQVGTASGVASYLLGLKLIQMLSQFSRAPFYSKLPLLARVRATGEHDKQIKIAKKGMALSYWVFVVGFAALGVLGDPILLLIGSNANFPSTVLWVLLGCAMFAERYGAMHIQLYSTTNHIIWHIVNGISGAIYLLFSLILFNYLEVYAFPVALLISYLGFYCWYSSRNSYRAFGLKFWKFERSTMIAPFAVMMLYCTSAMVLDFI